MSQYALDVEPVAAGTISATGQLGLLTEQDRPARLYVVPDGIYATVVKPAFDRLLGLVVLLAALPVLLIVAVAVRVKLGPGVIYRQERVGRFGEPFTLYKFRTMLPDRRQRRQPFDGTDRRAVHKTMDDPRHTPIGRFLRKWSIDELPQLWNVVKGDMSLIGPRPELVHIVERYDHWHHQRHAVKPGVTGLWQVSRRGDGLMHEHVDIDLLYVDGLSPSLDLKIALQTPRALVGRSGA